MDNDDDAWVRLMYRARELYDVPGGLDLVAARLA